MHCEINAALRFRDAEHLEGLVGNALSVHRQKWDLTHARQQTWDVTASRTYCTVCSLAGRYDNSIPAPFLAPIDCYKIPAQDVFPPPLSLEYTDKKRKKFSSYMGNSVVKSYMRNGFLIYEEMRKYLVTY